MTDDFDEALLSGYLDGELTQQDRQRVELHLERNEQARATMNELRQLREATMTTAFALPDDTQWDETPRNQLSRLLQYLGWSTAAFYVIGLAGLFIWLGTSDREAPILGMVVALAPLAVIVLVTGSALVDRLQTRKTDPYRNVKK